jgi:hypothetical protein
MTARNIRVEDDLWESATERAKTEGTTLSKLVRQWLADYANGEEALAHRPERGPRQIVEELSGLLDDLRAELDAKKV